MPTKSGACLAHRLSLLANLLRYVVSLREKNQDFTPNLSKNFELGKVLGNRVDDPILLQILLDDCDADLVVQSLFA